MMSKSKTFIKSLFLLTYCFLYDYHQAIAQTSNSIVNEAIRNEELREYQNEQVRPNNNGNSGDSLLGLILLNALAHQQPHKNVELKEIIPNYDNFIGTIYRVLPRENQETIEITFDFSKNEFDFYLPKTECRGTALMQWSTKGSIKNNTPSIARFDLIPKVEVSSCNFKGNFFLYNEHNQEIIIEFKDDSSTDLLFHGKATRSDLNLNIAEATLTEDHIFLLPTFNGISVDNCEQWARNCGDGGAHLFCKKKGFVGAQDWAYFKPGRTYVIGSNKICNGHNCGGYESISCIPKIIHTTEESVGINQQKEIFSPPLFNDIVIDNCEKWAQNCDGGGAHLFCRNNGYRKAESWVIYKPGKTYVLGSNKVCEGYGCDGYQSVVCSE